MCGFNFTLFDLGEGHLGMRCVQCDMIYQVAEKDPVLDALFKQFTLRYGKITAETARYGVTWSDEYLAALEATCDPCKCGGSLKTQNFQQCTQCHSRKIEWVETPKPIWERREVPSVTHHQWQARQGVT